MYFFWSKGTIKKKITGVLKVPWISGPVSDALQFPETSFVLDHGLDVGAASAQWIFHLLVLKVHKVFLIQHLAHGSVSASPGHLSCLSSCSAHTALLPVPSPFPWWEFCTDSYPDLLSGPILTATLLEKPPLGTSLVVQWLGLMLPMQAAQVQFLIRELRSCMLQLRPSKTK